MGLRCKVVDFIRLHLKHDAHDAGRIRKISLMNDELVQNVINALGRRHGRTTNDAMHLIALLQKKLCKVRTILTCDTCN